MTKERFLSVFEAYVLRTTKCWPDSAESYAQYLKGANSSAIKELGYPDYLEWIAESSSHNRAKDFISRLAYSVNLTKKPTDSTKSKRIEAITLLDQFIDAIFCNVYSWPRFGKDESLKRNIRYHETARMDMRVPNLCIDLKNEYIRLVDFAKHIFGNLFDEKTYDFIPVVLNPDKPISYYQATEEYLDKLSRKREQRQDTTEEENEILDKGVIACPVVARFYRKPEPEIEIFYRNTIANSREDYLSILKNCLAHEYMHYLHACYCDKIGNDSTYNDDEIREGIAEFFAMMFSLYRDGNSDWLFVEKTYLGWAKMFDSGWPYANALYMYKVKGKEYFHTERIWDFEDNGCIKKLVDVLRNGADFAKAYTTFKS